MSIAETLARMNAFGFLNAVPADEVDTNTRGRLQRIADERKEGALILSWGGKLYLPSKNPDIAVKEIVQQIERLEAQARGTDEARKGMQKAARERYGKE